MDIPKTIFANEKFSRRLDVILEELIELEEAVNNNTNIAEEAADIIIASYQVFYKLGYNNEQIEDTFKYTNKKNALRGYYENNKRYI